MEHENVLHCVQSLWFFSFSLNECLDWQLPLLPGDGDTTNREANNNVNYFKSLNVKYQSEVSKIRFMSHNYAYVHCYSKLYRILHGNNDRNYTYYAVLFYSYFVSVTKSYLSCVQLNIEHLWLSSNDWLLIIKMYAFYRKAIGSEKQCSVCWDSR